MLSACRQAATCLGCQAAKLTQTRPANVVVMAVFAPAWLPPFASIGRIVLGVPGKAAKRVLVAPPLHALGSLA